MSKMLERYWQIEYQLQLLWEVPSEARDMTLINKLNEEQDSIVDSLREDERRQAEDAFFTNH